MNTVEAELKSPDKSSLVKAPEVLRALVTKELKVKYKRSALGFLWSLLTPVLLTGVYLFVFIYVYRVPKEDFVIFLLSGVLPWNFFNLALLAGTISIVESGPLIRKVYFPRVLVPISVVVANLINFLMALGLLLVLLAFSGRPFWLYLPWVVLAIVLEAALASGLVMALSVWNVYLRDISQVISIMMMVLFFGTPIVYEISQVPEAFSGVILANPLTPIMEIFRAALFYNRNPSLGLVGLAVLEVFVILVAGYAIFRREAPNIAKEV